jgi:hypothetical protein
MSHAGLCASCSYRKEIRSDRGSVFTLCRRGLTDTAWPKYPRLPVLRCGGFEPLPPNIIFSAIDGVLVTSTSHPLADPAAVQAMNYLCASTGAGLVVKSSAAETPHVIAGWGIQSKVFSTPAIQTWFTEHAPPAPTDSFVILDSAPDNKMFPSRLIRTNAETGLTMADARQARQMLKLPG